MAQTRLPTSAPKPMAAAASAQPGSGKRRMHQVAATPPRKNDPSAPRLNMPARNIRLTASPVNISGVAVSTMLPAWRRSETGPSRNVANAAPGVGSVSATGTSTTPTTASSKARVRTTGARTARIIAAGGSKTRR